MNLTRRKSTFGKEGALSFLESRGLAPAFLWALCSGPGLATGRVTPCRTPPSVLLHRIRRVWEPFWRACPTLGKRPSDAGFAMPREDSMPLDNGVKEARPALLLEPHQPLWKRLPRRDADGRRLADFMMLIPGLRERPRHELHARALAIERVLNGYAGDIAFVELNLKLNTLWVSLTARPGLCSELPGAIQSAVPEALLVGPNLRGRR